eukprot:NODE_47_length_1953_cov_116.009454_g28_i0.p1 GENE.NODE_47_length_1953_cov_116.009454_g28_i0~~NODE_47_length_1953_cov_116.009454_g28_i0.p1  ORF type:complete len:546 (+),score=77.92 NODE_47_length_1953_cov_116.009454_g28_i0:190-1638(+)
MDELGIMMYQDMMFAQRGHAPHPDNKAEELEIRHQVRRLSHHPSIVIWDGCNECNGEGVYASFVMTTVASEDNSRSIWSSCPSVGWHTGVTRLTSFTDGKTLTVGGTIVETHGYYQHGSSNAFKPVNGGYPENKDIPVTNLLITQGSGNAVGPANKGTFASEFGCVVLSSFESMSPTLEPSHWSVNAPVMSERNYPCDNLIHAYFGPQMLNETGEEPFKKQLWQCMMAQTLWLKNDFETRRAKNVWGMLAWQLNEIWPTGGWGSIEYGTPVPGQSLGGRFKPMHYVMRQSSFTMVTVACATDGECYVRNDSPVQFTGQLELQLIHFNGKVSNVSTTPVSLPAGAGQQTWMCAKGTRPCTTWQDILTGEGCASDGTDCILTAVVGECFNTHLLALPKDLKLSKATVTFKVGTPSADGSVPITVSSDAVALYVTFTTQASGHFSDNAFFTLPNSPKSISFVPFGPLDLTQLTSSLRVEHMQMRL